MQLKLLSIGIALLCPALSSAQSSERQVADAFVTRLGLAGSGLKQESATTAAIWFAAHDCRIAIDPKSGDVISFFDARPIHRQSSEPRTSQALGNSELVAAARRWAESAQLPLPSESPSVTEGSSFSGVELANIIFLEGSNGYPARVGNRVTLCVSKATGELVQMERSIGFRYSPPDIRVTETEAQAAFARRLDQVYGAKLISSKGTGLAYGDAANSDLSEVDLQASLDAKEVSLHYYLEGKAELEPGVLLDVSGWVNAKSGRVAGGGIHRGTGTRAESKRVHEQSKQVRARLEERRWNLATQVAIGGLGLLLAMRLGILWWKKAHP